MYTVSPMKVGVMGGLFKDFGSTMTKKLMGWTDVGEEGLPYYFFFFPSPVIVVYVLSPTHRLPSLLGHPHRGDSFVEGASRTAVVLRALSMTWSRRQLSLAPARCTQKNLS